MVLVLFILSVLIIWGWGCARTVTPLVSYGQQMTVTVTLRGTLESYANRYLLVLSANNNFQIPDFPNFDLNTPEFIEPGMIPLAGNTADYYTKYYSTWAGYVVLDRNQFFSVKGPFVYGQTVSREVFSNVSTPNTVISFTFSVNRVFDIIPDTIYFDFVSVPWPNNAQKIAADHINSTDAYISKLAGSIKMVYDSVDPGLDPAVDILNCRVEIQ